MINTNAVVLRRYPDLILTQADVSFVDLQFDETKKELLLQLQYLSVDPYMRNRLVPGRTGYIDTFELDQPLQSMAIASVLKSSNADFPENSLVMGMLPWQEYCCVNTNNLRLLPNDDVPASTYLSLLGYPGFTAYVGIELATLSAGEMVFVSAAAGAVGSVAGQLAKLAGCYVVGSAGTDEKVSYLIDELGFDAAFNYKNYQSDFTAAIKQFCPNGIDVDFENVGGAMLESAIECLNYSGRVILCGAISQYQTQDAMKGPSNFSLIAQKRAKFLPFIVTEYEHLFAKFQQEMLELYKLGKVRDRHTLWHGLDNAWLAFMGLFQGDNVGKALVKIS